MGNPSDPRVTEIHNLLEHRANASYGLHGITQREHALQTVMFAGHPSAFIAAALLQDIGRLLHQLGHVPTAESVDDGHEAAGHRYLARWFAPQLTEPVRLHVAAKRYLCATELGYFGKLSADSVLSLALQGGPMSRTETEAFYGTPHWREAVQLRRYDEAAKVRNFDPPEIAHFLPHVVASFA